MLNSMYLITLSASFDDFYAFNYVFSCLLCNFNDFFKHFIHLIHLIVYIELLLMHICAFSCSIMHIYASFYAINASFYVVSGSFMSFYAI